MQADRLATELTRIADEARSARERLRELIRQAMDLRARLSEHAAERSAGDARKLEAVQ